VDLFPTGTALGLTFFAFVIVLAAFWGLIFFFGTNLMSRNILLTLVNRGRIRKEMVQDEVKEGGHHFATDDEGTDAESVDSTLVEELASSQTSSRWRRLLGYTVRAVIRPYVSFGHVHLVAFFAGLVPLLWRTDLLTTQVPMVCFGCPAGSSIKSYVVHMRIRKACDSQTRMQAREGRFLGWGAPGPSSPHGMPA